MESKKELRTHVTLIENEQKLAELQALEQRTSLENNQMILLYEENIKLLEALQGDEEAYLHHLHDETSQMELLIKLGIQSLALYRMLCEIEHPTQKDELDRFKYRKTAQKYNPEEVVKLDDELALRCLDKDFAVALFLNQIEEIEEEQFTHRFFNVKSNDEPNETGMDFEVTL